MVNVYVADPPGAIGVVGFPTSAVTVAVEGTLLSGVTRGVIAIPPVFVRVMDSVSLLEVCPPPPLVDVIVSPVGGHVVDCPPLSMMHAVPPTETAVRRAVTAGDTVTTVTVTGAVVVRVNAA